MIGSFDSFLDLFDGFTEEYFLITEDGTVRSCSKGAFSLLNYEPDTFSGKTIFQLNPNFSMLGWKKFWRKLSSSKWISEESELISSTGVIFPIVSKARLLELDDEKYCFYIFEDHHSSRRFEELLSLTSKISRTGAWSLDLVSQEVSFTEETARFLGLKDTGFNNQLSDISFFRHLRRLLDDADWKKLRKYLKQAIYQGLPFETEVNLLTDDNSYRRFLVHTLVQYSEDIASQIYGTIQDISMLVERSEDMYMAEFTVNHAREMIFWIEEDGTFSFVNELACEKLGYSREELLDLKAFDLSPEFTEDIWPEHWQNLRENRVLKVETDLQRKDGTFFPSLSTIVHIIYKGKEYNCSYVLDVSRVKQRDRLIHLTQHTIDQSQDLILWVQPDGQIFFSNQTAAETLGYTPKQLNELPFKDLSSKTDKRTFVDIWEELQEKNQIEEVRSIITKSGEEIPVEVLVVLLNFEGNEYACVTMRNIAAKRQKDLELRKAFAEINALKEKLEGEKTYLLEEVSSKYSFSNIITKSPRYRQVLRQITQVADTNATVLILGETGTGKELLARAIHELSDRDDQPLVKVNCAALPENLIESELFGHEKGAFTGAYQRKIGRFELADGGTIFLDEIGEMPLELQSKLLRVLQEGEFQRLGSMDTKSVDVRVIAATNRDLEQQVVNGKFREDLFYRLNVFPIYNLPLRERKDDIPLLVNHFMKKYTEKINRNVSEVPASGMDKLMQYEFPGNVRELENIIERAVVLSHNETLNLDAVLPAVMKSKPGKTAKFKTFEEMQREHILEALNRTHWKVTGKGSASELLGIHGKTLASKMRKLGISRPQYNS